MATRASECVFWLHVRPRFRRDGFGLRFRPECAARARAELDEAAEWLPEAPP